MSLSALISGVSVGANILSAVKVAALGIAVLGVFGFTYSGCQSLMNAGYSKAEADRLEALAEQNADALAKSKRDHASARSAERKFRAERDKVLAAAAAAVKPAPKTEGKLCAPGCVSRRSR